MIKFGVCILVLGIVFWSAQVNAELSGILQDFVNQNFSEISISKLCKVELTQVRNGLYKRELWALKLLDASGYVGGDFLWGNNIFIGSPKSCHEISSYSGLMPNLKLARIKSPLPVSYRTTHVRHWSEMQISLGALEKNVIDFGLCAPISCKISDIQILFKSLLRDEEFINKTLIGTKNFVIKTKELKITKEFFQSTAVKIIITTTLILILLTVVSFVMKFFNKTLKESFWEKFLCCFSIIDNAKSIVYQEISHDAIKSLHGLRVISMILIIVGHVVLFAVSSSTNIHHVFIYGEKFWAQPLMTLHLSVDTFFFLSGLILSHTFFQHIKKKKIGSSIGFFLKMVLNRFVRLTPPYVAALLLTVISTKIIKDTSPYYLMDDNDQKCSRLWGYNLLYINNFLELGKSCMLWSWFLAADFQCFLISAVLLIILNKHKTIGLILFGSVYLACTGINGYFGYVLGQQFSQDFIYKTSIYLYTPFWSRIGPYFVGVFLGKILSYRYTALFISPKWIIIGWTTTSVTIFSLIFLHGFADIPVVASLLYTSFARTLWAIAIAWIIFACSLGYGGYLHEILSAEFFIPLSRISYCAYLINPIWITFITMMNGAPYYVDFPMLLISSVGFTCTVFFLAFWFTLLFETPFLKLNKLLS